MNRGCEYPEELGRRERKKLEVHRRIRRAAARLISEKGYEATTVDEIAALADVAKGTFFNYFPRKDALLAELWEELLEDVRDSLGPPAEWSGSGPERLTRFFLAIGERVHRDPQLFKTMIVENLRNLWLREDCDPHQRTARVLIRSLLISGREGGDFPDDLPVELAAKLLEAVYATTTIESLKNDMGLARYRVQLLGKLNIIFRGLGAAQVCGKEA